jgi:hypothetical protein
LRWRCTPGSALRERAGPDAEVTFADIIQRRGIAIWAKCGGVLRNCQLARWDLKSGKALNTEFTEGAETTERAKMIRRLIAEWTVQ